MVWTDLRNSINGPTPEDQTIREYSVSMHITINTPVREYPPYAMDRHKKFNKWPVQQIIQNKTIRELSNIHIIYYYQYSSKIMSTIFLGPT